MKRSEFSYDLPESLIAQYPPKQRGDSRLLCLRRDTGEYVDRHFRDLLSFLDAGDLLIFNDTRVIPARLFGSKASGGRVEILVERMLDDQQLLAQLRASKSPRPGTVIRVDDSELVFEVTGRQDDMFSLQLSSDGTMMEVLQRYGHVPLPPYITRRDKIEDMERYQTIYARHDGAVAAPTAGLHFTPAMFTALAEKEVAAGFITLHVGAGTFQPLRTENIEDHKMHLEWFNIDPVLCEQINITRNQGGRVIAVGTTVVRCLESACHQGTPVPVTGETAIFIYPGYRFQVVDALITNFHLPESTLLMLVCAFAGTDKVLRAYRHAVAAQYRFFSYGDGMFIYNSHKS